MAQMIAITQTEFYGMLLGWILTVIFGFLTFMFIKFTPAKEFLKAKMKKAAVAHIKYRTGMSEFRVGEDASPGSMNVKNLGFVSLEQGSHMLEKKSRVPVYEVFSEYGVTIPSFYAPIIEELRKRGFSINTFLDYKKVYDIANHYDEIKESLSGIKSEKKKKKMMDELELNYNRVKDIKHTLIIQPYKAYKFYDLANMFPNGISPITVEHKVLTEVSRRMKKERFIAQMWITGALAAFILVIATIVLFKSGILNTATTQAAGSSISTLTNQAQGAFNIQ